MSDQRPTPPGPAAHEAAALRQSGASPLRPGDPLRVGPYVPLALLGSGGMGRVYLSRTVDDGPGLYAVKVIRPEYAEDVRFRRRFAQEASVHSRIGPPHAPRLCGTGFHDELLWMATEYVPGIDLAAVVREDGALASAAVWELLARLGRALAALAAAGIVHRDLKPSNVLLSVRGAQVIDFGIAKAADASAITGTGNRVGTPAYMSPEYLRTGHCDTASDVFSLAGTLVFAATGHAPFGDGTGVDVMHRVAFEEPNPEVLAAIGPELKALLSGCLAKEPAARPTPRDLIGIAEAHTPVSGWPEPLHSRVLARQRAYATLHRLPVTRAALLRPPGPRHGAAPEPVPPPAPAGLRGRRPRRKHVLGVAACVTLAAVTAGIVALTGQDAPATADAPEAVAPPPDSLPRTAPGSTGRPSTPGLSDGASPAGEPSGPAETGADQPTAHPSTAAPTASATPGTPTPTPSVSTSPSEPVVQPWNSECTHYLGSGRTRLGDSGKRVQQVQCILAHRGYGPGVGDPDGEFGADTESAVRAFQGDKGLTPDGVVDHGTWVALRGND
ncbi:protein kinase [Streptomyces sp. NPDC018693]|uniref:protein kinase domain-containing protein n=1 Tax=unclassified Streptomyces TaxID=2593676 RepID=UPI0037ABDBAC